MVSMKLDGIDEWYRRLMSELDQSADAEDR